MEIAMEMEFNNTILDASPWSGQLETLLASAFGVTPPAPLQLELAHQLRALMSELAVAPAVEATSEMGWLLCRTADSVSVFAGERMIAAQLGIDGSVATIEMGNGEWGAWSIQWETPLEGLAGPDWLGALSGVGGPSAGRPQPAVRIGIFQGQQRVSETTFDHAGSWEDDLDDQALLEETQRRLEESCSTVELPDEDLAGGSASGLPGGGAVSSPATAPGSGPSPAASAPEADTGGMALKGAAALAGIAAGALVREAVRSKAKPEPPTAATASAAAAEKPDRVTTEEPASESSTRQTAPDPAAPGGTTCPSCRRGLSARARFCPGCGAQIPRPEPPAPAVSPERPRFCAGCGTPTQEGDRFCRSCGQPL